MRHDISDSEARLALDTIELQRRQVAAEVGVPGWYWWGVALGWVALGVIADVGNAWATTIATLLFGAAHASVARRALSGRHRSRFVSVRADVAGRRLLPLVVGALVLLVAVTVGVALLVHADGADHPSTIASVIVALAVLAGGPALVERVGRGADRRRAA